MADFNLEGLLGNIGNAFGGGDSNFLNEYLTPEQRRMVQRNAMLAASAALLKAGGESTRRIGIGEALGSAFEAGQAGYEKAQTGALTQMALKTKLDEAKDERQRNVDYFEMLRQASQPAPPMQPAPLMGAAVPPVEKLVSETASMARPAATGPFAGLSQQQLLLMRGLSRDKGLQFALDAMKPEASPDAIKTLRALGLPLTVDNLRLLDKPEASPSEVRILQATGTPVTFKNIMELRKSGAASTTVNLPPQEKAYEIGLGTGQSKQTIDSMIAAQSAATILETNQTGRNILNSGAITGTGANFFVGLNNALKQAGIDAGYADAAANSQAYAAAMGANVGQLVKQFGAGTGLSDADREFATQMAGGKITLTEQALRKILDINDKAANKVIDTHNKKYGGVKTNIPLTVEKPVGAAPPPPSAASQIPGVAPAAPASNITQQRQDANAAIARGAPAAAVRQRFKQNTGQEL